jgi:hypothetical protein
MIFTFLAIAIVLPGVVGVGFGFGVEFLFTLS